MNRTIRDVLLFGAGFAAGAYVMHTVFRTKYQEYADAQIDDVRDHYRKKEADLDTMIEEKAQQKSMLKRITQKLERMVHMMAKLWAQEIMFAETMEEAKALYERCPRLLKEKVKAILIKSGFEEITQE